MKQFKLTPDQVLFLVFHEVEHLLETAELRSTRKGQKIDKKHRDKFDERGKHWKVY
jgi:hypothetical protein